MKKLFVPFLAGIFTISSYAIYAAPYHAKSYKLSCNDCTRVRYLLVVITDEKDSVIAFDKVKVRQDEAALKKKDFSNEKLGNNLYKQLSNSEAMKEAFNSEIEKRRKEMFR